MDPIAQIAEGREPTWTETFTHPTYGELTFSVSRKLTNADWLRHSGTRDLILQEQGFGPDQVGSQTGYLAAACAGIGVLMDRVKIGERRVTDDVPGHEKIEIDYYDPLDDDDLQFPIQVWDSFFAWRMELLGSVDELKKDSATTGGVEPGGPSHDPTGSPQTTSESKDGQTLMSSESSRTGV